MTSSDLQAPVISLPKQTKAIILFVNFLLIILAYYFIKPASRSLFVEYIGAENLPYVWIGTALVLGTLIGYYYRLVERFSRQRVVLGTCLVFIALLLLFRLLLESHSAAAAVAFYIFVDIFSVVLVEQFWSLTNTVYSTEEGKRWYGFVGTGGLVGGVIGGAAAALLLKTTTMKTEDLLLAAAAILGLIFIVNLFMVRLQLYREIAGPKQSVISVGGWRKLFASRYIVLIAILLLLAQLAQPLVEYAFMLMVEQTYQELDARTAFISGFFSVLGLISIGVNLILTPLIHRYLGVITGLITQPLVLGLFTLLFIAHPVMLFASMMKISDRGLSYSINRASRELLYVPIDPVRTYQAKAWIDMFGYRLFKVVGSLLILTLTQWLPLDFGLTELSGLIVACCAAWIWAALLIAPEYHAAVDGETPAPNPTPA